MTELARRIAVRYKEIEKAMGGPLVDSGFGGRRRSTASSTSTCASLTPSLHHQQSYGQLPGLTPGSDYSSLDSSSHSGWGNGPVPASGRLGQLSAPEGKLNLDDVDGFWEGSGDAALPGNHHHHQQGVARHAGGIVRRASVGHPAGAAAARQQQQNQQLQMLHGSMMSSMSSTRMLGRMGARRLSLPDIAGFADNSQTEAGGGYYVPVANGEVPNGPSRAQLARQARQAHGLARSMPASTMTTQHEARMMELQPNLQAAAALGSGLDASDGGNLYHLDASSHRSLYGGGQVQPVPQHPLRHSVSLPVQNSGAPSTTSAMIPQTSPGDGKFCVSNAAWTTRGEGPAPVAYAPNSSASFVVALPPQQHHHHHRLLHSAPATRNPSPTERPEMPTSAAGSADPSGMMLCQIASEDSQTADGTSLSMLSPLGQATAGGGVNMEAHPALVTSRDVDSPNLSVSRERQNDRLHSSFRSSLSSVDSFENLLQRVGDGGLGSGLVDFKEDDFLRMLNE